MARLDKLNGTTVMVASADHVNKGDIQNMFDNLSKDQGVKVKVINAVESPHDMRNVEHILAQAKREKPDLLLIHNVGLGVVDQEEPVLRLTRELKDQMPVVVVDHGFLHDSKGVEDAGAKYLNSASGLDKDKLAFMLADSIAQHGKSEGRARS